MFCCLYHTSDDSWSLSIIEFDIFWYKFVGVLNYLEEYIIEVFVKIELLCMIMQLRCCVTFSQHIHTH